MALSQDIQLAALNDLQRQAFGGLGNQLGQDQGMAGLLGLEQQRAALGQLSRDRERIYFHSPVVDADTHGKRIKADMSGIDRCPEEGCMWSCFLQQLRVEFDRSHKDILDLGPVGEVWR